MRVWLLLEELLLCLGDAGSHRGSGRRHRVGAHMSDGPGLATSVIRFTAYDSPHRLPSAVAWVLGSNARRAPQSWRRSGSMRPRETSEAASAGDARFISSLSLPSSHRRRVPHVRKRERAGLSSGPSTEDNTYPLGRATASPPEALRQRGRAMGLGTPHSSRLCDVRPPSRWGDHRRRAEEPLHSASQRVPGRPLGDDYFEWPST